MMRLDGGSICPHPPSLVSTPTLTPTTTAWLDDQYPSGYVSQYSGSSMSVDGNSARDHTSLHSNDTSFNQSISTADNNTSIKSMTNTKDTGSMTSSNKSAYGEEEDEELEYASGNGAGADGNRSCSAMDLDDFNQLFGLGIDLDVSDVGSGIGQPPPIQSSFTVTPAQFHLNGNSESNNSNSMQDFDHGMNGISLSSQGSVDNFHSLDQYLNLALQDTKAFGSFSEFRSSLDGDSGGSEFNTSMAMNNGNLELTDTNIMLGRQLPGDITTAYPLSHHQHRSQTLTSTPAVRQTHSLTNYRSPNLLGYPNNTSDASFGASSVSGKGTETTTSTNSFVQSSPDLVPPSSVSPMTLQYGSTGRVVVDVNGNVSGGTGDGNVNLLSMGPDGLSFAFSGLNSSGGSASASRSPLRFQGNSGVRSRSPVRGTGGSTGINLIMRRANSTSVGALSKPGTGRGVKKVAKGGRKQHLVDMSIPLPIPTRSKKPSLIGWEGDPLTTVVASMPASPPRTVLPQDILPVPPYPVCETSSESRKRKRGLDSGSDDDSIKSVENVSRRELLGLRKISKDTEMKLREEEEISGDERKRKRRRIGSLSSPRKKGKGKARKDVVWTSDDDDSDDLDDSDAYFPSSGPSSPGANNDPGPSSRPVKSMSRLGSLSSSCTNKSSYTRSLSTSTLRTPDSEITSVSLDDLKDERSTKRNRSDKHSKGKARGSAAFALAKVTMLSGKSPTSAWGTYVPFALDGASGEPVIRSGRTRRNGHIPLPVPVPDLIKKSRGRKVPHQEPKKKLDDDDSKRVFICEVLGCGKCFVRGEHLKRHVRSIHTHDKRQYLFIFLIGEATE